MKLICSAVLSFMLLSSCLKKQNLDEIDLGPAYDPVEIETKMTEAIGGYYVDEIRKNEMSSITAVQILEDSQVTKVFRQDLYVTDVINTPDRLTVDTLFNLQDFNDAANSLSNQPFGFYVDKKPSPTIAAEEGDVEKPQPHLMFLQYSDMSKACKLKSISCYNFSVTPSKMFVPSDKASPKVCPDIRNCLVETKNIQFDLLDQATPQANGKPLRLHFEFVVSTQVPFFSKVLKYCKRGLGSGRERDILIDNCYSVTDFSYGQE